MLTAGLISPVSGRIKCSASVSPFVASLGGHPATAALQLTVAIGLGPPVFYMCGLGYGNAGGGAIGVVVDPNTSAITTVHQGMPFVANGALACDTAAPVTYHLAGIPHVATGHIAIDPDTT